LAVVVVVADRQIDQVFLVVLVVVVLVQTMVAQEHLDKVMLVVMVQVVLLRVGAVHLQ
jgi:hypothetical protein